MTSPSMSHSTELFNHPVTLEIFPKNFLKFQDHVFI